MDATSKASRHVRVELGERSYTVHIGPGVRHQLVDAVAEVGAQRAVVVSARPDDWTPDPGVPALRVGLRDGEAQKTLATVEDLCRGFATFGLTRHDVVVSCGGGTTTDTVGLAAAIYHRGTPVVHVPTSLLAQVDANYGHTLGHALERATDFALHHGEAVAIGTVFAGRLAGALGRIDEGRVAEHLAVVEHYHLPTALPREVDVARLVALMRRDKKATTTGLAFVLDGPDGADLITGVPEAAVVACLDAMPRGTPLGRQP